MASLADNLKSRRASEFEHRGRPKIDLSRAKDSAGKLASGANSLARIIASTIPRIDEGTPLAYDEAGNLIGGYDPEAQVEKVINWLMPMGSVAEAVDTGKGLAKGVLKTFGGIGAKTADKEALAAAEALEKSGADMRDIWQRTGWYKAPWDGKWRWEIDDSAAQWAGKGLSEAPSSAMVQHPELFQAYPAVGELPMAMVGGRNASYVPDPYEPHINIGKQGGDPLRLAAHELQHGIQAQEGFAFGGDSKMAFRDSRMWGDKGAQGSDVAFKMLEDRRRELMAPLSAEQYAKEAWGLDAPSPESMDDYVKNYLPTKRNISPAIEADLQRTVASDWYKRLAGEAEARLVQDRLPLTAAQRREQYPLDGLAAMLAREGIDPGANFENLITRHGDGPAMSVEPDLSRFGIGAPELRAASDNSLAATLERMRARNLEKGLDEDMATGAIRDEQARRQGVAMLGLPEDHTAMDRARVMFPVEAYHGTGKDDLPAFRRGITWAGPKDIASEYASLRAGWEDLPGNVLPLSVSANPLNVNSPKRTRGTKFWSDLLAEAKANNADIDMQSAKALFDDMRKNHERIGLDNSETATHNHWQMASDQGKNLLSDYVDALGGYNALRYEEEGIPTIGVFRPQNIRSRFAAFDPSRRDSANLLASLSGAAVLAPSLADYLDRK